MQQIFSKIIDFYLSCSQRFCDVIYLARVALGTKTNIYFFDVNRVYGQKFTNILILTLNIRNLCGQAYFHKFCNFYHTTFVDVRGATKNRQ